MNMQSEIEQAFAANRIFTMASGDVGPQFKFFFYAQDAQGHFYLAETLIEKAERVLRATVKGENDFGGAQFSELVKRVLFGTSASLSISRCTHQEESPMAGAVEKSVLTRVRAIMDRVYSPYTGPAWTPLAFPGRSRRYLWSDAFGVCNYISLSYCASEGEEDRARLLDQADALIRDVHAELGCYRNSQHQLGSATRAEPTLGGLRIGKEDEQDDGQYYHYLTKWMFALNRMSIARDDPKYNRWAIQLAEIAHKSFVIHGLGGRALRMVWKMSVDLQHVTVSSEGNLDPFDGLVTYRLLQHQSADKSVLKREIADMVTLVERKLSRFATSDELDSGEALWLAEWFRPEAWANVLHNAALQSIDELFRSRRFEYPPAYRLLFREMGTVLGLKVAALNDREGWDARVAKLLSFWSDKVFDRDSDISPLMYASALLPGVWDPHTRL